MQDCDYFIYNKENKNDKQRLSISLDKNLYEKMREISYKERISLNKLINKIIKKEFTEKGKGGSINEIACRSIL